MFYKYSLVSLYLFPGDLPMLGKLIKVLEEQETNILNSRNVYRYIACKNGYKL